MDAAMVERRGGLLDSVVERINAVVPLVWGF
jgi:hypothetical protein